MVNSWHGSMVGTAGMVKISTNVEAEVGSEVPGISTITADAANIREAH